jgi:hypothetical protein
MYVVGVVELVLEIALVLIAPLLVLLPNQPLLYLPQHVRVEIL